MTTTLLLTTKPQTWRQRLARRLLTFLLQNLTQEVFATPSARLLSRPGLRPPVVTETQPPAPTRSLLLDLGDLNVFLTGNLRLFSTKHIQLNSGRTTDPALGVPYSVWINTDVTSDGTPIPATPPQPRENPETPLRQRARIRARLKPRHGRYHPGTPRTTGCGCHTHPH